AAAGFAALIFPAPLAAWLRAMPEARLTAGHPTPDEARLEAWTAALRAAGLARRDRPIGRAAIGVGERAEGTPYRPGTLEAYLRAGGSPAREPLTASLTRFDCVTLVESCLAVARVAGTDGRATWAGFGREIERMRYRGGVRRGYTSRLHYFSEWISDGAARGLVRDLGKELGGVADVRSLRFMTEHRASYPALGDDATFAEIGRIERGLDARSRFVVPTKRIPQVVDRIESGDVLAFATEIPGLDVTHAAFAYRGADGVLRVLHAPLSGGVVEITRTTLPEYVAAIRRSTGILVARPAWG
ncbi:MAG TPA: N-acetylmuramoyl-L-alanine amidase-like domain-containing protein, partial [Gemmatimonadales bacterium]|nr:N-acetylmuramoyl-L-alanine amidase-like domain-containing protein [Gemmatimonadales bacterium]